MPDDAEIVEKVAKAICSRAMSGFCRNVGGDLGCLNGRGVSGAEYCVATPFQLIVAGHEQEARSALAAYRDAVADDGK